MATAQGQSKSIRISLAPMQTKPSKRKEGPRNALALFAKRARKRTDI